ncbi:ABC transporter permease [Calditerrivibrio sp.]|uniref:ABC transporter permease n=1 Tax=Calditerrivibrio sp. TaxID=2792612 RepID=UPI003D0F95FF
MVRIIYHLGKFFVDGFSVLKDYLLFCNKVLSRFLTFKILNPAIFMVTLRQIYFTGVQIIRVVVIIAIIFGLGLVGTLGKFLMNIGAYQRIGTIFVIVVIREVAPFLTALLLSLRSATAVGAEISMMKLGSEIRSIKIHGIDEYSYLFLPRIFAGMVCSFSLAVIFSAVSITIGYFLLSFQLNITFDYMVLLIFDALNINDIFCFIYKTTLFGFTLMTLPIFTSMGVGKATTDVPIALLKGMMRVFYGLIFVEITGFFI